MKTSLFTVVAAAFLLLVIAPASTPSARAASVVNGDALSLVVTYRATPGNRAALLYRLGTEAPSRFAKWQHDGVVSRWQLLYNRYPAASAWDAMAVLTFARPVDVARWSGIERQFPGGLTSQEAGLTAAIDTVPVDLVRDKREAKKSDRPVFLVIPYKVLVPAGEYLAYADGYALPQFDGWIAEGILAGYRIYQSVYPAGRPWSTLLVLEYRSDAALSERDAVKDKVRARLKNDPKWKAISDNKKSIRDELEVVVAQELEPAQAGH